MSSEFPKPRQRSPMSIHAHHHFEEDGMIAESQHHQMPTPISPPPPMLATTTSIDIDDGYKSSILRFVLLPSQVMLILLLEFLNSFRSFGLRFVLYNYITNEFGIDDANAGKLLGIKGFVDISECKINYCQYQQAGRY